MSTTSRKRDRAPGQLGAYQTTVLQNLENAFIRANTKKLSCIQQESTQSGIMSDEQLDAVIWIQILQGWIEYVQMKEPNVAELAQYNSAIANLYK